MPFDRRRYSIREDWDWNWLEKLPKDCRTALGHSLWSDAWNALLKLDWLSVQSTNSEMRTISDVRPISSLTNLHSLVLGGNAVFDLQPLTSLRELRYLHLNSNEVVDTSPLSVLQKLEHLEISDNPVSSLASLEKLPNLRELHISTNQVSALADCRWLPSLQILRVYGSEPVRDLKQFPEMPSLKVLDVDKLIDFSGIDRFTSLTSVRSLGGTYSTLSPLVALNNLTHFYGTTDEGISLHPLHNAYRLRSIHITSPNVTDIPAVARLPVLHELNIGEDSTYDAHDLETIRSTLSQWSEEFRAPQSICEPSLDLKIVSKEEFEFYDTKKAYGLSEGECADDMLGSETNWILDEIASALSVDFEQETDFILPGRNGDRRSQTLALYSLRAYESFREIALTVQNILCHCRNPWIIYTQALLDEGPDAEELPGNAKNFIVWIYPNKILATEPDAKVVEELIRWR